MTREDQGFLDNKVVTNQRMKKDRGPLREGNGNSFCRLKKTPKVTLIAYEITDKANTDTKLTVANNVNFVAMINVTANP